jgi:phage terminase large subunit
MEVNLSYQPYAIQQKFHKSQAKFRGFIGGLGSGKTLCGAYEALQVALEYSGSLGVILAPTYRMLTDSTIRTFLEVCPHDLIEFYNKSEQHLKMINGSEILFRPGNDTAAIDRLRNVNVGWFWMDEGSLFLRYAFQILIGRLREQKGPRRGWVTTTPKGYNWIWDKFVNKPTSDYFYVTASSLDNPYLPEDYKRSLQQEYTGVFARQEIYGLFVGFEGCVYPEFNRAIHVIDTSQYKFEAILGCVDFGFTNPSVILKIGIDYDGRLYVLDEFYERHVTDSDLAEWAKNNLKDVELFIADSENPAGIQEFKDRNLEAKGVKKQPLEPKETFIISGIKRISNLLVVRGDGRPRLYVDQKCVNTIMEFENYRYPEKTEEQPMKEAPLKIHDHALDSLRYLVSTLGEEGDKIIFLEEQTKEEEII